MNRNLVFVDSNPDLCGIYLLYCYFDSTKMLTNCIFDVFFPKIQVPLNLNIIIANYTPRGSVLFKGASPIIVRFNNTDYDPNYANQHSKLEYHDATPILCKKINANINTSLQGSNLPITKDQYPSEENIKKYQ